VNEANLMRQQRDERACRAIVRDELDLIRERRNRHDVDDRADLACIETFKRKTGDKLNRVEGLQAGQDRESSASKLPRDRRRAPGTVVRARRRCRIVVFTACYDGRHPGREGAPVMAFPIYTTKPRSERERLGRLMARRGALPPASCDSRSRRGTSRRASSTSGRTYAPRSAERARSGPTSSPPSSRS
jgi:hypothetical protein